MNEWTCEENTMIKDEFVYVVELVLDNASGREA